MTDLLLLATIALAASAAGQHQHAHPQDRAQQGMGFDQQGAKQSPLDSDKRWHD